MTAAGLSDGWLSDLPEETCSSRLAMDDSCWLSCEVMACERLMSATRDLRPPGAGTGKTG